MESKPRETHDSLPTHPFDSAVDALWHWQSLPFDERDAWLALLEQHSPSIADEVRVLTQYAEQVDRLNQPVSPYQLRLDLSDASGEDDQPSRFPSLPGYQFVRLLGEGGHSRVWLAYDRVGDPVAVKILRRPLRGSSAEQRFRTEQLALHAVNHPNIARLLNAGTTDDDEPYMVLEYVDGVQLLTYAATHQLSVAERVSLLQQMLAALHAAHAAGIVHRDIKPDNVLVSGDRGSGMVKLIDFGIAKLLEPDSYSPQTMTGDTIGTPAYMSPEQVRQGAKYAEAASDIFSAGVVAFELLTGRLPYEASELAAAPADTIRYSIAPRTTQFDHRICGELDDVIARALRKEPLERYPSVQAFSDALGLAMQGQRVEPRTSRFAYRVRHWWHAYPKIVSGVLGGLILVSAIAAWSVSSMRDAERTARWTAYGQTLLKACDAIKRDDPLAASELLASRPQWAGPEWGWLASLANGPPQIWKSPAKINAIAPASGGIAVGTLAGEVYGINLSGKSLWNVSAYARPVTAISWDGSANGSTWIGHDDGVLRWFNGSDATQLQAARFGGVIRAVAAHQSGAYVACDRSLHAVTRSGETRVVAIFPAMIECLALTKDGALAIGLDDGALVAGDFGSDGNWQRRWIVTDAMEQVSSLVQHDDAVVALDGTGCLWWFSLADGSPSRSRLELGSGAIRLAVAADMLAVGYGDGRVARLNLAKPLLEDAHIARVHRDSTFVTWVDGKLVSAGWDKSVRCSSYTANETGGLRTVPTFVAMHASGEPLLVADGQNPVSYLCGSASTDEVATPDAVTALETDGASFWIGCRDGSWSRYESIMHWNPPLSTQPVTAIASRGKDTVWLGYADGSVRCTSSGTTFHTSRNPVRAIVMQPQGTDSILAIFADGSVIAYPAGTVHTSFEEPVGAARFESASASWAAIGTSKRRLLLKQGTSPERRIVELPSDAATPPTFDRTGIRILVGLRDGSVACIDRQRATLLVAIPVSATSIVAISVDASGVLHAVDADRVRYALHNDELAGPQR